MLVAPKRSYVVVVDGQPHVMNLDDGPQDFPEAVADAFVSEGAAEYLDEDTGDETAPARKRGRQTAPDGADAPLD